MSTHTPGPWRVVPDEDGRIEPSIMAGEWYVATVVDGADSEPPDANARLIAAAPDMLAMLRICHEWLQGSAPHRACAVGDVIAKATQP